MRIGVLRGGPSTHYELSLRSGANVIRNLRSKHPVRDIYIDRDGNWHYEGLPIEPARLLPHIDVFWNALHGEYGEDGTLQRDLDHLGAKYTGPGGPAARLAWRKDLAKRFLRQEGLLVPESVTVEEGDDLSEAAKKAFQKIGGQYVVKPSTGAHSEGVFLVTSFPELGQVLELTLQNFSSVLIEEAIHGKEIKCLVANGFRGERVYSFFPVEIEKPSSLGIYRLDAGQRLITPARLGGEVKEEVMRVAKRAYATLGLEGAALVDMVLAPRGMVILEVDALPELSEDGAVGKSLAAVGATPLEFFDYLVTSSFD